MRPFEQRKRRPATFVHSPEHVNVREACKRPISYPEGGCPPWAQASSLHQEDACNCEHGNAPAREASCSLELHPGYMHAVFAAASGLVRHIDQLLWHYLRVPRGGCWDINAPVVQLALHQPGKGVWVGTQAEWVKATVAGCISQHALEDNALILVSNDMHMHVMNQNVVPTLNSYDVIDKSDDFSDNTTIQTGRDSSKRSSGLYQLL